MKETNGQGRLLAALLAVVLPLIGTSVRAQEKVQFQAAEKVFRMDGGETTYAFGVNEKGELQTVYWGGRLSTQDRLQAPHSGREVAAFDGPVNTTQEEYVGWGAGLYVEPALKVRFGNGNRGLELRYVSHVIAGDGIKVTLKDVSEEVYVELHYVIDGATGIIGRSATIMNRTKAPIMVDQAAAATWNLPRGDDYTLRYLTGRWGAEWQLQQQKVQPGATVLESRRGSTGQQNNPWFAVERGSSSDEETGEIWFGALAWSGSWRITVEQDQLRQLRVTGGYNPFDFSYKL